MRLNKGAALPGLILLDLNLTQALQPGLCAEDRAFSPRVERFASFRHPQFLKDRLRLGKAKRKSFGFSLALLSPCTIFALKSFIL